MSKIYLVNPVNPVILSNDLRRSGVPLRLGLRLLHTLITTNRDLFPCHGHLDSAIIDRPITDRTFARVHVYCLP